MKSLFKSVAIITVFAVFTRLLGFVFRIYLSRTIGAEALGMYQVAFSVFSVLVTVVASGIPVAISKHSARYQSRGDQKGEAKMLSSAVIMALVMSVALCIIVLVFNKLFALTFTDERCVQILIMMLPAVVFSAIYSTIRGSLWGHSNYFAVGLTEFFEQVSRIVICVLMLGKVTSAFNGALKTAGSLSIACALSAIFVVVLYFAYGGKLKKPSKAYKDILKTSTPITGVRFATSLVQPIIAILIPLRLIAAGYSSAQAMSLYGIAVGMTLPFLFIPSALISPLSMALIPDLSVAEDKGNAKLISERIKSSLSFALFISFFLIPIFIGAGQEIGQFFYANSESGYLLAVSSWVMIPLGLTNITSAILNGLGLETKSFKNNILGSVFMLLGLWFLPKYVGIRALAYAMGICMSVVSALNIRMIKKKTGVLIPFFKPLVKLSLFIIPTAAITAFLCGILQNYFTMFFVLAIACSVGAIFFITLSVLFKVIDIESIFVKLKKVRLKKIKIFKNHKKKA